MFVSDKSFGTSLEGGEFEDDKEWFANVKTGGDEDSKTARNILIVVIVIAVILLIAIPLICYKCCGACKRKEGEGETGIQGNE